MTEPYAAGAILRRVRAEISRAGGSEHLVAEAFGGMDQMFQQLQELRTEMNTAKRAAADAAAKPYLELMQEIETRYALLLKLGGGR